MYISTYIQVKCQNEFTCFSEMPYLGFHKGWEEAKSRFMKVAFFYEVNLKYDMQRQSYYL